MSIYDSTIFLKQRTPFYFFFIMNADSQLNTKIPTGKSEPPQLSNPMKHFEKKK